MYKGRGHNLPRSIAALRTVKRAFAACAVMAIVLGIVASLDSLIAGLRAPEGEIALVPGTSEMISGTLPDQKASNLLIRITPITPSISVESLRFSSSAIRSDMRWHASISASKDARPGDYSIIAEDPGEADRHSMRRWTLKLYPSLDEYREHSYSLFMRFFGTDSLQLALRSFAVFLVSSISLLLLVYFGGRSLAKQGYCRVYYARTEGNDTMLYCIDSESLLSDQHSYPVFSAAGQLLGLADVTARGTRHCVLKLYAAQARAGCLVAVTL